RQNRILSFAARYGWLTERKKILRRPDFPQPLRERRLVFKLLQLLIDLVLSFLHLFFQRGSFLRIVSRIKKFGGRFILSVSVRGVVEERHQLIVFPVHKGVIRMAMTLNASDARPLDGIEGRAEPVENCVGAKLFVVGSAFVIGESISMKSGR